MTDDPAAAQQLAARVAGAADLLDVRLLESRTKLEKLATEGSLSFTLTIEHKVEQEHEQDFFVVRLTFQTEITQEADGGEDELVATIVCEYAALYDLVGLDGYEPSAEEYQAYSETAATLTIYPYARELISSMVNRLGLPRLVLPTHRLPSPWHPDSELSQAVNGD